MDIEGAEAVLFKKGNGVDAWIDKVDNIAIELHDDSEFGPCTSVFADAIADRGFDVCQTDSTYDWRQVGEQVRPLHAKRRGFVRSPCSKIARRGAISPSAFD